MAIIEKVTHGSRRTVDFSLPIGTNDETRLMKTMMRMRRRTDSIVDEPHIAISE
jgi:hypothetical protein